VRSSAESNALEHRFEHDDERGIGGCLTRARPGKQRAIADRYYGDPQTQIGLNSEAALALICADHRATEGAIEIAGARSGGHQRRRMPVHGYLGHVRELDALAGEPLKVRQIILRNSFRDSVTGRVQVDGHQESDLVARTVCCIPGQQVAGVGIWRRLERGVDREGERHYEGFARIRLAGGR